MKGTSYIFIFLFFISLNIFSQISFNATAPSTGSPGGNRPTIFITGPTTGDQLRNFIQANPTTGTVVNRDITFNAELKVQGAGTLTDNNAVYHFPDIYRYAPQAGTTVTFTDVTIHYTGSPKGHSYNGAYTANFTRVFYLLGVTSGRSDFFNNGNYTFNFEDVTFSGYGGSDFLHFQTNTTLENITINTTNRLNFEPGARLAGEVEIIRNLKLRGVTRIVGGSGSNGDFKAFNMDWDATNWNFSQRNVDFFFVNPVKPTGWTGYSGAANRVQEFYTHDVIVTEPNLTPINNINILLYNNNANTFDYNLTSDTSGQIPTQEVLKIDNSVSLNFDRGNSTLVVADYLKTYYAVDRNFNEPISDNIVVTDDEFISETNTTTVAAYAGITVNHSARTLTISANRTLCEVYDFIKLNKINNLEQPNITTFFATPRADVIDLNDYQLILSGSAILSPCDKFVKLESDATSSIADLNNLDVGLQDATQFYKFISIANINNANLLITDLNTSTEFLSETNFTGTSNSVTTFASNQVRLEITRDGYTNWATIQDFSGPEDIYKFVAHQAPLIDPSTSINQEEMIFLAKKILQKNVGILKELNGTNPTLNITNINQNATIQATEERQIEILNLLKRILTKTTAIKKGI
ncbi:hypothetical protein [Tenacibaculum jejuense]|uniref:Uncharacterized protein n=1 Tax=Tenacibaculum jejuense TaxID=584609 RepID=A0A238U872_9FLAO|nr:hypothetical protein [Tenacibaculum jejuense]SNR15357.1 Protein of unknown function precursor [Tenacibaculum jejuense]